MTSVMRENLIKNVDLADTYVKMIITQQTDFVDGTFILKDMLELIRGDLRIMDKEAVDQFDAVREKLVKTANERKKSISLKYPAPEDEYERRDMEIKLLREDYERFKRELLFIKQIAYQRKWFE